MAEAWASGHRSQSVEFDEQEEAFREAGADDAMLRKRREAFEAQHVEEDRIAVYPENLEAFECFLALQTAWEFPDGMGGGRLGVPAGEIAAVLDLHEVSNKRQVFRELRLMMTTAREILHDQIVAQRQASARG